MADWLLAHLPDPRHVLVFQLAHLGLWLVLLPPSILIWRESVPYLVFISVWALIVAASNVASVLAEIKADPEVEVPSTP